MTTDDPQPIADTELPDLESRITARRGAIIAKLVEIKAESSSEAAQMRSKLKARLSDLGHILKEGVVDGWAHLGDIARHKLERWLAS